MARHPSGHFTMLPGTKKRRCPKAPPKFREETSKKAVRLSAVCETENGLRNRVLQAFFAAPHNFLSLATSGHKKTAVPGGTAEV